MKIPKTVNVPQYIGGNVIVCLIEVTGIFRGPEIDKMRKVFVNRLS